MLLNSSITLYDDKEIVVVIVTNRAYLALSFFKMKASVKIIGGAIAPPPLFIFSVCIGVQAKTVSRTVFTVSLSNNGRLFTNLVP